MSSDPTPAGSGAYPIQLLLRQGRTAEAERASLDVLKRSPMDVEALNVAGMAAAGRGEHRHGIALLERARQGAPDDPLTLTNLGMVYLAAGSPEQALESLTHALRRKPDNPTAALHKGKALEGLGRGNDALAAYFVAVQCAQAQGRWLNKATIPPAIEPLVRHAVQTVRRARGAMLEQILAPMRDRYGRSDLARVERCISIYLGEQAAAYSDPRQRPTFLYFPDLPPSAYLPLQTFPWIADLEALTAPIREELLAILGGEQGREAVFHTGALERANLRGVAPTWNGYYFFRHGERNNINSGRCPRTAAILDALPLARIREHAPEVLFSVFTPGTHLLPHRGVTNTRVVAHLPLIVPSDCALVVGGEQHVWREGQAVVFDDTYEHEAWNRSGDIRVVLIADVWNPYLTEIERAAVADVVAAVGDFRKQCEAAGP